MNESTVALLGGFHGNPGCANDVEVFTLGRANSQPGPALLGANEDLSAVALNERQILVHGGVVCNAPKYPRSEDTYLVDLDTQTTVLVASSTVNGPR